MPVLSPDGRSLAYLAMSRAGFEADRFEVVLRDLSSGETRALAADWDRSPSSIAFTPDGAALFMNAQDVGHKTLWRLDIASGDIQRIREGAYISAFDLAGDRIVYAQDSLTSPSELFVAGADGGDPVQLTRFGEAWLSNVELGDYEQFSFAGAGDDTVHGFVVKPAGFDATKSYPVAFLIHGGPQGSFANHWHYRWNPQTYAGAGFAVVMIDFHGSTGYGQAFTDSISGDWGGKPLQDLQLGLAAALERYGFLDGERVCALGASYGGFMINWIAGHWPDRFRLPRQPRRCLRSALDVLHDRRAVVPEWENGGPYFEQARAFERHNPANFVSAGRRRCWSSTARWTTACRSPRASVRSQRCSVVGIESRFVYFPDENHWVLKPHNSVRWHEEVNGWLKRFLD
jgi:dipeptidyl aminopeptidase/acylaminoacyl peptidase